MKTKAVPAAKSKEQRAAKGLNPSLDPTAAEKRAYDVLTYRAARKNRR